MELLNPHNHSVVRLESLQVLKGLLGLWVNILGTNDFYGVALNRKCQC